MDGENMELKNRLPEMQLQTMPRLDWRTMVNSGADQLGVDDVAALDGYFSRFIQQDFSAEESKCPCCDSSFGKNGLMGFLMSGAEGYATLQWGLAHGEAFCSKCHYPFRVYHRDVGPIKFLSVGLAYHPEDLNVRKD